MTPWMSLTLGVLALSRQALCASGDICSIYNVLASIIDDRLYFIGGNYSTATYDGQVIKPSTNLYYLDLDSQFPVERTIPKSSLHTDAVTPRSTPAYNLAKGGNGDGVIWTMNDTMYFFGGGFGDSDFANGVDTISSYNASTGRWKNVQVNGGNFNFGNRSDTQSASIPEAGLGFVYGGREPYMHGMIRFDASDPNNPSWTNETLNNGSHGVDVPRLNAGAMVYVPAGKEGMLISFGGGNITQGLSPSSGWPFPSDWNVIYVYDIASHTWWMQKASGDPPIDRTSFCAVVTESPDRSAFHITTYGGWSLTEQRSYEDVNILTIPSFQWIDATELSKKTNLEQQVNSTIGRDGVSHCQIYQGAQMVVLGGNIRAGAYSITDEECSNVFDPTRVLELSTYKWQTNLDTNSTYKVPSVIYDKIGGGATGGATITVPSAGFADATLASLIQKRVPNSGISGSISSSSDGPSSTNSSSQGSNNTSSHVKTGAIAGGVVGGVAGLALIIALTWYLVQRKERPQTEENSVKPPVANVLSELPGDAQAELPVQPGMYVEMPGGQGIGELQGESKPRAELRS
ncbi:hypothetical protein N7448_002043 [Penicillium atrosanguineum]|nr:hypothetical protein N7448_002043 [Penicillium atrosanguineum]